LEARTDKYATQRRVFDNLGQGVLDNAFEGEHKNQKGFNRRENAQRCVKIQIPLVC